MAGFEVTPYGRFCLTPEEQGKLSYRRSNRSHS
jgi:hypothetical protein